MTALAHFLAAAQGVDSPEADLSLLEAALPPLLREMRDIIGLSPTLALVQRYGGLRIYIPTPANAGPEHPLAQIIGHSGLLALAERYGGSEHFQLPKGDRALLVLRNAAIVSAYTAEQKDGGKTARALAAEHGLTESQIVRILGQARAEAPAQRRQAALF